MYSINCCCKLCLNVEKKGSLLQELKKRFEFEEYQKISIFLKKTDELCKEKNIYPNISFGKNFVSVSIFLDSEEIPSNEKEFSIKLDNFFLEK